ncbi:hypothetical protein [Sphingobacterium suaedae]|uniref:DUF3299 domain-containing protein n=1 Tax=Sphingobacterium suaedae TaxID=1686402 RepID=A0ABW5KH25_9SPHI
MMINQPCYRSPVLMLLLLLHISIGVYAQDKKQHVLQHKPLMNDVWKTFDMLLYKVEKSKGQTKYIPYFPPALKALEGKHVTIRGYMVPLTTGRKHNRFLLSVLPIFQCMFCGQDGIPAMVEVQILHGQKLAFSKRPLEVIGTVAFNGSDQNHTEIILRHATAKPID